MSRYASETTVPVEKSRIEIEQTLTRYGASHFGYMSGPTEAIIAFSWQSRRIRFNLPLPDKNEERFQFTSSRRRVRSDRDAFAAWEKECRRVWRALALVIKAKLEAIETGITTFDEEFLAHIVRPDGLTVAESLGDSIKRISTSGDSIIKHLLPAGGNV